MAKPGAQIDPMLGKLLADRFEIIERIGEGGMGVVYRARQISVDRMVAIKLLNSQAASDPTWVQRFINEARACSKLQHPNTIRLIDFGQSKDGLLFIAMEFLDGMNLRQALERGGAMPPQRVLKIVAQACQSLAEAHAMQIIHRDLKPDNLFIINMPGSPDYVKVLDFSVAKLRQQGNAAQTQAGVVFGTPQYMSPEQGRGLPLDARSDIYALGIVAYELLAGKPPFSSPNPMEVLAMHVRTPVPPIPGCPERVFQIVTKCLAKDQNQRYQAVEELLTDCQIALAEYSTGMAAQPRPAPMSAAPPEQKTLFAPSGGAGPAPLPFAIPPAASTSAPAPAAAPPASNAEARTMMAMPSQDLQDQLARLRAGQGAPPQPGAGTPPPQVSPPSPAPPAPTLPAGLAQAQPGAPQKTMLLESSEGIVSFAQAGHSPMPASPQALPPPQQIPLGSQNLQVGGEEVPEQGSSALFWIVCILAGVGIGVLAYLLVSKVA